MTRRVTENSQEKKTRQGVWGVEDLRKRPAPIIEAGGGSTPWIFLVSSQGILGDATFYPMVFDQLFWDPALVTLNPADVEDGSDPLFHVEVASIDLGTGAGSQDYFLPYLRHAFGGGEGWYEFEVAADIGDSGDGAPGVFWELDVSPSPSGGSFPSTFYWNERFIWNGTDMLAEMCQRTWKLWSTANRAYILQARQNTGQEKDLSAQMLIRYLGGLGGSTDSADWEFASP